MPRLKTSKKDLKQSRKRHIHNLGLKKGFKKEQKSMAHLLEGKDAKKLKTHIDKYVSVVDKAVVKKLIHKNTASRIKSRLLKKINGLAKAGSAKAV
jgi:small subunit ribosomal protein S20